MKRSYHFIILFLVSFGSSLFAETNQILAKYVSIGLEKNLALKQKEFDYEKSLLSLKEARGLFYPSVNIEARYSRAGGGRNIEFPVGSLLNPVYSSLNQLFNATNLPTQNFPILEDQKIPFLRKTEHETKIRIVQPLLNPSIIYNYKIQDNTSEATEKHLKAFKSQLIASIKNAYYNYAQTVLIVELFNNTRNLINENIRISQALFDNQVATKDVVLRSESEKYNLEQQLADAEQNATLAQSYFNFLLNRDLDHEISIVSSESEIVLNMVHDDPETLAIKKSEEIQQLELAIRASENAKKLYTSAFFPNINLVFDYGFQGEKYSFTSKDDYWMGSAILSWNLFNGFQDGAKREKFILEKKQLENQLIELQDQIRLQTREAVLNVKVALKKYKSADKEENLARETYKIISKKFAQGLAAQIEILDAQTNLINSGINRIVAYYSYLINHVNYQHIIGEL